MVLFTDGIPNRQIGEDEGVNVDDAKQKAIYDEIVKQAYETKNTHGAQVYSICTTTVTGSRDFLNFSSSNYPNAAGYTAPGKAASTQYFHEIGDFASLRNVFESITESTASVAMDETAVLQEVLTDYFVLNPDDEVAVEVYTAKYNGDGTYAEPEPKPLAANKGEGYHVEYLSSDGTDRKDIIQVTGFDYAGEYISSVPRTGPNGEANYYGSKLIVKVRVRTRDGFWGGNNVPTNEPATGIYDKNSFFVEEFPVPQVNVPIEVTVTARDKTIYYDGEVDTDKDEWEGDELLQQITAGGKPVKVDTVTNPDGTTTTTFKPEADWMDDFATMDWVDGSTTDTSDLSNTDPKDYTYAVVVTPNTDGSQNNGTNPGSTDNIAGEPQPTQGERADDTGHIYILVPELTFKDSVTDFGTDIGGYDFDGRDFVDEKIVWVDMELGKKPGDGIPALDQNAQEPELELEYTPEGNVTQFVGDTRVDVTVSINDKDITGLVKFNWESCGHTEHGSCGTINTHEGEDAVHEFWVHTTIAIVPDTVVIDYGLSVDIDPLTNDLTHVKNVTKTLKRIDYAGTFGQAQVVGNEVRYTLNTANFGPNNELYLAPGQGISFTLAGQEGNENVQNVHLALKSVGGTSQVVIYGIKVNMKPNGGYTTETIFVKGSESSYMEVKSATDLYYDITKVKDCYAIVIYNPNNPQGGATHSILSVTNLKLTHAQNPETRGTVQPMVSRGMAEVALMALKPAPVNPFADVQTGSFYEKAVLWAVENGITKGVAADSFAPSLTCTRGQVVTFLYCAYTK